MKAQVISFHCIMRNKLGHVLSSSFNQDVINQSNIGSDRLPGLVEGLQSVREGEKRSFTVPADSAYGGYDPRLVIELRRSEIEHGERLRIGSQILRLHGHPSDQRAEPRIFRVIQINGESLVLDGNHPLAGQDLIFEVEIVSARDVQDSDLVESSTLIPGQLIH